MSSSPGVLSSPAQPPREVDLSDLPGVLWDERVGALRAPAMLHGAIKAELSRRWLREISATYCGPVGCLGDGERRLEAVTVATFESAWRQGRSSTATKRPVERRRERRGDGAPLAGLELARRWCGRSRCAND